MNSKVDGEIHGFLGKTGSEGIRECVCELAPISGGFVRLERERKPLTVLYPISKGRAEARETT